MVRRQYLHPEDEPMEIRLSLAKSSETTPNILAGLSHDKFWFVRDYVAANPHTPKESLMGLLQDTDFRVREEARRNLALHHGMLVERNITGQEMVHKPLSELIQNATAISDSCVGRAGKPLKKNER